MSVRGQSFHRNTFKMLFILLRYCVFSSILFSFLVKYTQAIQSETQAMMYLSQFGYLSPSVRNPNSGQLMTPETMSKAITEFQSFAGINITGHLDEDTLEMMSLPRCGVRDRVGFATSSRSKRYALQGSRWRVKDLTYKISKYPRNLGRSETDEEVRKAFSVWSDVTPLSFTQKKTGQVHIEIRFERGEHGDGDPFDGPGGTLAHAFFPVYGGDAHFDDAEKWTVNSYRGTNLFQVAAHEFGHSLGLSHSDIKSALMAPFYRGYDPAFTLDDDDVEAIQALYGGRGEDSDGAGTGTSSDDDNTGAGSGKKPTTEVPPTDEEDAELCTDATIDAIFNSAEGETYAFKGLHYWKLTEESIAPGYPKLISKTWIGLPGNIDAAFTYKNGKTYFFKDAKYWRYTGKTMDSDYPRYISDGFTGIPDNVDAAIVWSGNGKIYFFKEYNITVSGLGEAATYPNITTVTQSVLACSAAFGTDNVSLCWTAKGRWPIVFAKSWHNLVIRSKFWRFDPTAKPPVKSTYPKPLSNWEGIPDNIDAALHYTNGYTYFFKGGKYWRFNDRTFAVDIAEPPFPRPAGYWWFGCRPETKGVKPSSLLNAGSTSGSSSASTNSDLDNAGEGSDLDPSWAIVREDHTKNQNIDVDDLILDAESEHSQPLQDFV